MRIKVIGYGDSTFQTKVGYKINPSKVSNERNNVFIRGIHNAAGNKPLIIIDGKKSKKLINDLNPDDIKSVTVLKGEQAIKKFGNKAKNGVVLISTKEKTDAKIVIRGIHANDGTKPLIIIDDKESKKTLKDLKPDGIKSVTVLKGEQAIKSHGDKGKNGVVVISTKERKDTKIVIRGIHTNDGTKPLIIIDGKESKKTIKDLCPDDIKSVTVLKGEQAIKRYGDKGKNGVIEITTKQN